MYFENNLLPLFFAILPIFLYMFLFYKFIPNGFINSRRSKRYFVIGLLSPTLVTVAHFIFPGLHADTYSLLFYCIFQIGMLEEITKYTTYYWTTKERKSVHEDSHIATMYYVMLTSLGFALVENIEYLMRYGNQVLFIRGCTAIVLHMLCGVIMGYFIAKAKNIKVFYKEAKDQYQIMVNDYIVIGKYLLVGLGLFVVSIVHGVYDYNLMSRINDNTQFTMVVILIGALSIGYFMIKELIQDSLKQRRLKEISKVSELE